MKPVILILFFSLCISATAFSQDDFKPEIKIGTTLFTGWEYNSGNDNFISSLDSSLVNPNAAFGYDPVKHQFETSQNSFYLDRAYLTLLGTFTPTVKGRVTTDLYSITDGAGKTQYQLGLKFAWLDWTPYKNENGMAVDLSFGILPNQWITINEKYYGYRGFAKTLTDFQWITSASKSANAVSGKYAVSKTQSSYFTPADLGANLSLTGPKGIGELYLNVFNGNGFRNISFDNRFKDVEAILFVHPLAEQIKNSSKKSESGRIFGITELTFGGFVYLGKLGLGENFIPNGVQYQRNRLGGMVNLKYNFAKAGFVKVGGEYSIQSNRDPSSANSTVEVKTTSTGFSSYLEFNPPVESLNEKLMLVARYDSFDPDNLNDNTSVNSFNNNTDKQSLLMLSLAYKPSKYITLGLSYQQIGYQLPYIVNYDGLTSTTDSKLLVHGILEF